MRDWNCYSRMISRWGLTIAGWTLCVVATAGGCADGDVPSSNEEPSERDTSTSQGPPAEDTSLPSSGEDTTSGSEDTIEGRDTIENQDDTIGVEDTTDRRDTTEDTETSPRDGDSMDVETGVQYEWRTGSWSSCSVQCRQTRDVFCQNVTEGREAPESNCETDQEPPSSRSCTGGNCVQKESNCRDGLDNDRDNATDCADSDCSGETCASSGSGAVCKNSSCTETACSNGQDDDGDGQTDCRDADCQGEVCASSGQGAVCQASGCVETACNNGRDDDGDGGIDCADADCMGEVCASSGQGAVCQQSGCSERACNNGRDDDGDGAVDCNDSDCSSASNCTTTPGTLPPSLRKKSDLKFWLQSTNVKTTGSSVTEWTDQSGNDFDFVPGKSPSVVSNQIAGYPAVRFEGNSERLNIRNRANNFVKTPTATFFVVFKNRDASHEGQLLSSCGGGVGNNQIRLDSSATELYVHADGFYRDEYFRNLTLKTTQWHVMTVVMGSSTMEVYQNGQSSGSKSVQSGQSGSFKFNEIGNRCSESEELDADVAEMLLYNRELSTRERQTVESYLQGRYNL